MTLDTNRPANASTATDLGRTDILSAELSAALAGAWIPSLPQILLRVLAVVDDENVGLEELAALISRDPGLCARVLAVANSPALRRGGELRRIEDCVSVLGTRFVRTMAACLAVQSAFDDVARQVECDLSAFWLHSLEVAELARAIALAIRHSNPEEAYLAGLLHDTGQLLLLTGVPTYGGLLAAAGDESMLCDLELRAFGADHGAVGAWLVGKWCIDSFLADAILFHHEIELRIADSDILTRILWAAHAATMAPDRLPEEAARVVGLDPDGLASLRAESRQRTGGIAAALGIAAVAGTLPVPAGMANLPTAAVSPLTDAARSMAFAQPLQESLFAATSDDELFLTVRESARILFGLEQMALLTADQERHILSGAPIAGQPAQLPRLKISLTSSYSLAARAAVGREVLCSFAKPGAALCLTDIQILRALNGEGLLCVPLAVRQKCSGVLAFGVNAAQWPRISRRLGWLANFARIVAASFEASRETREREQAVAAAVSSHHYLRARQIAHEAGNPLAIIRNYLKLLERKLDGKEPVARELAFLDEEISRVAGIICDASDPAPDAAESPRCDIEALIEELLAGYRAPLFASRGIGVEVNLPAGGAVAAVRREPLLQVLLNLWKNASEAMKDGGSYRIEVIAGAYEGSRCLVEVRLQDSGPGLAPEAWTRLAAGPVHISSQESRGLGLGIVIELVAAMGGRILCASQPDRGTLFSIHLPAAEV